MVPHRTPAGCCRSDRPPPARRQDEPVQHVQFADGRVFDLPSGGAMVCADAGVIYLALPLRNAGVGVAVLQGYHLEGDSAERTSQDPLGPARHRRGDTAPDRSVFSEQQRDPYVAAGSLGFWQAALRDPADTRYRAVDEAIQTGGRITVDLLYTLPGRHSADRHQVRATTLRWRGMAVRCCPSMDSHIDALARGNSEGFSSNPGNLEPLRTTSTAAPHFGHGFSRALCAESPMR